MIKGLLIAMYLVSPSIPPKDREALRVEGASIDQVCKIAAERGKGWEVWWLHADGEPNKLELKYEKADCPETALKEKIK